MAPSHLPRMISQSLNGRGHQKLDGAGAFLFGEEAHGNQRDQEEADHTGVAEQGRDHVFVDAHGLLLAAHCCCRPALTK